MYRFLLLLLIAAAPWQAVAQLQGKPHLDSLLKELPKPRPDSEKIKLLDDLSYEYHSLDPDAGIIYANEELKLAKKNEFRKAAALAYRNLGLNYSSKADLAKALDYFNQSINIFEELKDTYFIGVITSNIGIIYQTQGNFSKSLEYYFKSLTINESLKNTRSIAGDLGNIGNVYLSMNNYPKALEYGLKSLKLFEALHDTLGIANNLGNIGNAYQSMRDYKDALQYDVRAEDIFEKLGDKIGLSNALGNIGAVYQEQKNYSKALDYTFRALNLCKELGDKGGMGIYTGNIGEIYLSIASDSGVVKEASALIPLGKTAILSKAVEYLQTGLADCTEGDLLSYKMHAHEHLAEAYRLLGNYKEALINYKEYASLKDSIYSNENRLKIADLESRREVETRDKQIRINELELKQKRFEQVLLVLGIILLLLIVAFIFKKLADQKRSNALLATEKKKHLERIEAQTTVLKDIAEMQSHGIGGPVATILGLVQLFNYEDLTDPTNQVVIEGVAEVTKKLDVIVKDVVRKENNLNRNNSGSGT